jgi:hypothetical protein
LKRTAGPEYDPDIILTVGTVTRDILASSPGMENVKIKPYGSPRLAPGHVDEMNTELQDGCLVAPDGVINECIILFTFAIEVAKLMPGTNFIFRTHPFISFADLQEIDSRLQHLPENVVISSNKRIMMILKYAAGSYTGFLLFLFLLSWQD